ncbi:M81 family metallopeptidase [Paracoccus sp. PAR01]|uniref:M81 family metallopeptidase n=1 Tax=Paracoccus sp. PAR01 TaxID=2769282 RepID=UPI001784F004|nr:M81 family metallopeptidase [Paracoccus sp. PAR01]MBD9528516.1 M81 family metallopeptidase [Paracoccus sp. PAR01]
MRVAFAGFLHESNSFASAAADMAAFRQGGGYIPLTRGAALREAARGVNLGIAGMLDYANRAGWNIVPILWTGAIPSAPVTREAFETIADDIVQGLADCGPIDAICLDLHGAMVAEHVEDGEGELLARIRAARPDLPIACALDLHGNITPQMFQHSDIMVGFRTYPHVDMAETGWRAAAALDEMLASGRKWAKAMRRIDFLIPIAWQCSETEPARGLYRMTRELPEGVATASIFMGFPAADFPGCGPAVLAYGPDALAVQAHADRMAKALTEAEADFAGRSYDPEDAVREAMRLAVSATRPVIIADTQDNPGAGGSSDTTGMLRALIACGAQGAALGNFHDPEAARAAHAAGVGAEITLPLGGRSGLADDAPFPVRVRVAALSDGHVHATGPYYGGTRIDMGPSAALEIDGIRVVVTSHIAQMADRNFYRMVGITPEDQKILVNKSSVHFRADFEPIAETILVATAPGAMPLCPSALPWTRLRAGMRLRPMGPVFKIQEETQQQ